MRRAKRVAFLFVSAWLLVAGFGSLRLLAQDSPPSAETVQPAGEGVTAPIETPTAEPPASSEAIQERRVPGLLPPGTGILQQSPVVLAQPPNTFYVKSYGGKCLDFGPPPKRDSVSPVFIAGCNGDPAQQVQVQEVNSRHEVILRAGTKVLGVRGATAPPVLSRGTVPQIQSLTRPPAPFSHPPPVALTPLPAQVASQPPAAMTPQVPLSPSPPMALQTPAYVVPTSEALLELQDIVDVNNPSAGQIFALDGDSIILVADRSRVVQVQNNRGANRTALILGSRNLADGEFWTFVAADKTNRKPTSGFRLVRSNDEFVYAVKNATWGTVIEVDPSASIVVSAGYTPDLKPCPPPPLTAQDYYIPKMCPWDRPLSLEIGGGVTIRGNRRGILQGPELSTANIDATMLEINGNDVRITGLRLRGPSSDPSGDDRDAVGIRAHDNLYTRSIIDHNELSAWTHAAVLVDGGDVSTDCRDHRDPRSRPENVSVVRNFIQYNQRQNGGYGVSASSGGYVRVEGNTFIHNRHAVTGENGYARSGFRAWYNFVLSDAPAQKTVGIPLWHTQDFDMHGTDADSHPVDHVGGRGGEYVEIAGNTFLGTNRPNFKLRGTPCHQDEFRHNVSLQSPNDAVVCAFCPAGDVTTFLQALNVPTDNQFNVKPNPTEHLRVGDFDSDGTDDLFLATAAAWYYAPAGNAEWRFLNAQTDGIGTLLFGDFDGDGRTDVFTQHGRDWLVSWGGASPWEKINESNPALSEFRIGDFNGDHLADVFYADGKQWYVSYGGNTPFTTAAASSFRAHDLGFGDFNGDGKTDVVAATSGQWMVSLSATGPWSGWPLRPALTNTMAGLIIADFNGNGRADIATSDGKVSYDGRGNWTPLRTNQGMAAIGRFDNHQGADVLYWDSRSLRIVSSGVGPDQQQSRQDMR